MTRIELRDRIPLHKLVPLDVPLVIFVDPSDVCNFHCKFCPTGNLDLMEDVNRPLKLMDFDLFTKIVDDICKFDHPIKVLRLYKDGEPLMNPNFAKMVKYAKDSGCCERVDTTTNASLLNPKRNLEIINAGLDRINISIEGVNAKQYEYFCHKIINWNKFISNIKHFYDNRKQCEVFIKIAGDNLSEEDKQEFFRIFGDICDGINIEHTMNCWNEFEMKGIKQNEEVGIYGQPLTDVDICPYVFYSFAINSDGTVSLCFLDWNRKLLIDKDVRIHGVKNVWHEMLYHQLLNLKGHRRDHPICKNCSQLTHGMPENLDPYREEIYKKWRDKNALSIMSII